MTEDRRPTIETERLTLRPFTQADAPLVHKLASDRALAATTLSLPHPYTLEHALTWISTHADKFAAAQEVNFAVVLRENSYLIGSLTLRLEPPHDRAELGYWIGKAYWNHGFCTEAARAVLRYGFEYLNLNRIYAHHFKPNQASGRVMKKLGMRHEGTLVEHIKKWDQYVDYEVYGIARKEYPA